ncbi:MAG: hypothetical protein ACO3PB_08370 [Miltoncostaeaceae bacterium]
MSLTTEAQEADLRGALNRALRDLARARAKTEDLVDAVYRAVGDAIVANPPTVTPPPRRDRRKGPEEALWHLTDWQGSKVTNSYTSEIMRQRVGQFVDKARRITEIQRAEHPVRACTIVFGGDMVEGLFNFPSQPYEVDATIFGQFVTVSRLIGQVVERALGIYETVTVVPEWGNHGRIGSKRDSVPRADNIDRMCYEMARQLLAHEKRLTWQDCPEDIQRIEIGAYRALAAHGDEAGRNGYISPQAMIAHVNRWKAGAYPWDFQDVYLGHYHRHAEEPLANGDAIYWTGSTESDNRYAREQMAASSRPSQRLHFIDPEKGRVTAIYKVHLD